MTRRKELGLSNNWQVRQQSQTNRCLANKCKVLLVKVEWLTMLQHVT